jgi:hypothetical protein
MGQGLRVDFATALLSPRGTNRNGEKIEQTDFFSVNAINDPFCDAPEQLGAGSVRG